MNRIAVLGCGGSGKTTLARRLATALHLPVTHLDALRYDHEWNQMPHDAFADAQRRLVAGDRWIIDGNNASTLPIRLARADTVILLDMPALTCLTGIAQRRLRYHGGQHDDGVYDRITRDFLTYVWRYRSSMAPRVRQLIAAHARHADVHILRTRHAANRLTQRVSRSTH